MRLLSNRLFIGFVCILCFQFFTFQLQAEFFKIDHYLVNITVSPGGYFDVEEKILVSFDSPRRGIFRKIPIKYTINGKTVKIRVDQIEVRDNPIKVTTENGYKIIRIGKEDVLVDGVKEYWISYRVTGAFLWLEEHTEFYWNIIGTEWDVPIEQADYNIYFPEDMDIGNYDYELFSGPADTDLKKAMISKMGSTLRGKTTQSLRAHEGIALAVKLAAGTITNTSQNIKITEDNLGFIPLGILAGLLFLFSRFGRNKRGAIEDEYYPPEEMNVSEAGAFFDHIAHNRDLLALIPQWGLEGIIRMKGLSDVADDDYYIEQLKTLPSDAPAYQRVFFNAIFEDGPVVLVSDLKNKLYGDFSKAQRLLKKEIKKDKWVDEQSRAWFHKGWFILLGLLSIIAGVLILVNFKLLITGILALVLGITCIVIHFLPARRSETGFILQNKIKGLKQFLKHLPDDQIKKLTTDDPAYFEKLFPYAVAFGIDKAFINKFKAIDYHHTPSWYYYGNNHRGYNQPSFNDFSSNFKIRDVSSVFTSSPASSGSSGGGFSGGSSGGGFGGGGGGSW